ncbi:MAG: hypothetical protein Kow006_02130 [Gammaproteobacteria bacterium]
MDESHWYFNLYKLGRDLSRHSEASRVQDEILRHVVDAFRADTGTLALYDRERGELTIVAGIDLPAEAIGQTIAGGVGVMGWVAEQREPLLLNGDVSSDPRFTLPNRSGGSARVSSAMCWPLGVEERLLGVISINRQSDRPPFDDEDLEQGRSLVNMLSFVLENALLHRESRERIRQLEELNERLEEAQNQLLQSEKLASIGQLAAGVAHEINNPIGYVNSNLSTLRGYMGDFLSLLDRYQELEEALEDKAQDLLAPLRRFKEEIDLDYLREDSLQLMDECDEGITRVKKIVQDLKDFSRVDSGDWEWADLHVGLETTLNVVWNEIKYKAEVEKQYGELPNVRCMPSQINQVFMNLLVNAAQAMEERGTITIRTRAEGGQALIEVEDTGKGMPPEVKRKIFDPFFTTKPVGKGTGLGLSLSYGIIQKHGGSIEVESEPGKGTRFRISLPIEGRVADDEEVAA